MSSIRKFKVKDAPELDEIRKGFEQYDYEKKGTINPHDLRKTMDQMNMYDKNPAIYEIIKSLCLKDFKDSEGISYDDFIDAITKKFSDNNNNNKENLKQIFDVFTEPRSNTITLSSFVQIARELRETVTEVELKEMLQNAGENGKEITFEEFYEIMTKNENLDDNSKKNSKRESKNNSKRESRTNIKKTGEKDKESEMNSKRSSYNSGRRSKA
jgi:Ca2+-binding EF-hand superfamily protein